MSTKLRRNNDGVRNIDWLVAFKPVGSDVEQPDLIASGRGSPPGMQPERETDDREQLQQRITEAKEQGRQEGQRAGEAAANQRLEPVLVQLKIMLLGLSNERASVREASEKDVVQLAVAIARRVLHRELATDREAILGLVKAAFSKLNAREAHRLRLCPADVAVLEQFRAALHFPENLALVRDPALVSGSAIFETSRGELDASVDTQLEEIQKGLADTLERKRK